MRSPWRKSIIDFFIYMLVWLLAYAATVTLFKDSPSRSSYGLLSGWWCSLYVGHILKFHGIVALIGFLGYLCFGMLSVYLDWMWFYHDLPTEISFTYVVLLAVGGAVFVSPIILNSFVEYWLDRFKHK